MNIDSIELMKGDDYHWYRETTPKYKSIHHAVWPAFNYSDPEFTDGSNFHANVFNHAHNEACSCSNDFIDTIIATSEFKINQTLEAQLQGHSEPCSEKMQNFECHFFMQYHDRLDLSIENLAGDRCIECYGVGHDLWPLPKDQLITTLTRSEGYNEDCSPKQGYHKSARGEIYRCETGDDISGVIAFSEAKWENWFDTCGFQNLDSPHWILYDRNNPITTVSNFLDNFPNFILFLCK